MNMTMKEATVNGLIGLEIFMWFIVGECIGKGSLIGYNTNEMNSMGRFKLPAEE